MCMKTMYPQPDFARGEWLNLNGIWDFSFDAPTYDKTINVPYAWGSPLSGIDESKPGTGYYRKTVAWNPAQDRIFLIFGAVDYTCEVRLNGKSVGTHTGGYTRFEFDVTEQWNRNGENTVEVTATDLFLKNQTFGKQGYGNACGIWQTVWLEARPTAYISAFSVVTKCNGDVTYEVECPNAECATLDADFADIHASATVKNGKATVCMHVEDPKLWTPETPDLYEGTLKLTQNGVTDTVSTYFGIREIGTGKFGKHDRNYITLNGKPYYINGVLDQSFNPQGFFTLPSDEDCKEEILRLKRLGINMARIHIKAEEPLKLYYADKLGMLIMEDIPCFWEDPLPETKKQFEYEMEEQIKRDRNHPATFYWVVFNETWGLFNISVNEDGTKKKEYTAETAEWVVRCWERVKEMDPTRLVEDNSPCNKDHTKTDVNTWHCYFNGYENVKRITDEYCQNAYVGSQYNYKEGYTMEDVPFMNSECGNVWGVQGNAGESDISWQYKYMMNEFRRQDKLCGFVFTEFHDVVNEFNGYYKLDNSDKDFGYGAYGMTLRDLHSQDYLGADFPPMKTVKPHESVTLPMFGSSFTDLRHGKKLTVAWTLTVQDPIDGDYIADLDEYDILWEGYGTFDAGTIEVEMPEHDGVAVLSWTLYDGETPVMTNCTLFDIDGTKDGLLEIEPRDLQATGFERVIDGIEGKKKSGLGTGAFEITVKTAEIPDFDAADDLRLMLEVSTREPMTHDYPADEKTEKIDLNYMLGYRCDPGENRNSFKQTDEVPYTGTMEILVDDTVIRTVFLEDCPADSRGALSHHYQPVDNLLDEAGSYGQLCDIRVPSRLLLKLKEKESFKLTFRATEKSGLSIFGRQSGRYGIGLVLIAE